MKRKSGYVSGPSGNPIGPKMVIYLLSGKGLATEKFLKKLLA